MHVITTSLTTSKSSILVRAIRIGAVPTRAHVANTVSLNLPQAARQWVVAHAGKAAHVAEALAAAVRAKPDFKKRLPTVYLINDAVFRAPKDKVPPSHCTLLQAFQYQLPYILNTVATAPGCAEADGKEKLAKIVQLWSTGTAASVYPAGAIAAFHAAIVADSVAQPESRRAPSIASKPAAGASAPISVSVVPGQPSTMPGGPAFAGVGGGVAPSGSAAPHQVAMALAAARAAAFPVQANAESDPNTCQVGRMVSMLLGALDRGVPRYAPVVLANLPPAQPLHMEPGRLQVRVAEFHRKVEKDTAKRLTEEARAARDAEERASRRLKLERRERGDEVSPSRSPPRQSRRRGRSTSRSRSPRSGSRGHRARRRSSRSRSPARRSPGRHRSGRRDHSDRDRGSRSRRRSRSPSPHRRSRGNYI